MSYTYGAQVAKGAPSILVSCHLMTKAVFISFELLAALLLFVCLYTTASLHMHIAVLTRGPQIGFGPLGQEP